MQFFRGSNAIRVNIPDRATLEAALVTRWRAGQGFGLATLNLDHLVKLRQDGEFRLAYQAMDLVTADGNPIVWLSRLARRPVRLLPGSDLLQPLLRLAVQEDVRVAFLGSTAEALAAAEAALAAKVPGLNVATRIAPPMGFDPAGDEAADMLRRVEASGARLCIVALGAPKQEVLAARGRSLTPGVGYACLGASLDFHAGTQRRAPRIFRALALEWLWRAGSAPARLGPRYLRCAAILPSEVGRALALRRAEPPDHRAAE